jgi:membrane associated rhomboid family serine protease
MVVVVGRRIPPFIAAMLALMFAMSIASAIDAGFGGSLSRWLDLRPSQVWSGEVWRLVTWPFLERGPLSLLFAGIAIFYFGPDLHERWGRRRFVRFVVGIAAIAGVGTCLGAFVFPMAWWLPQDGGMVLADAIVIAWALQFPDAPLRFYHVLVVRGGEVVSLVLGVTLLFALFYGVAVVLPELLAGLAALVYMDRPDRRWRRTKRARRRDRGGLEVIDGDHHGGPYYPN